MRVMLVRLGCCFAVVASVAVLGTSRIAEAQQPAPAVGIQPPPAAHAPSAVSPAQPPPTGVEVPPPAAAPTAPALLPAEPVTEPVPNPALAPPPPAPGPVDVKTQADESKKLSLTAYGFVEFDVIGDSTQSFNDLAGNASIARSGSYAAKHGRVTFGARNSRIGLKLGGPEIGEFKPSAVLEMDFLGNQPAGTSESALFVSPLFRIRHAAVKLEDPYVDILLGQSWQLFGWQPYFHPNTVEIQGVPGQIYSRAPQARLSHRFKSDAVDFELALAAARSPQRNSATPDGQAGARLFINKWKGVHTTGGTGTAADAAAIGVSGVTRRFALPEFSATPTNSTAKIGWGFSADAMLPIIPASMDDRSNALTLTGSFITGEGIADLFTGLTGGVTNYPALPANAMGMVPTYTPDIDAGDVMFDSAGKLRTVGWQAFIASIQYYFPGSGKVWMSANYSNLRSHNAADLANGKTTAVFKKSQWADVTLFWDAIGPVRLGLEGAWFEQTYADNKKAHNLRAQFSTFYIF